MMNKRYSDPVPRFWSRVEKTDTCWIWTGAKHKTGHAQFTVNGKNVLVHRFSWELHRSPIPKGMVVDHLCHNPSCVNPEHLRVTTQKQNMENRRGACKGNGSGARGVNRTRHGTWTARVKHNRQSYYLGTYKTVEEAAEAAREFRKKHFAVTN